MDLMQKEISKQGKQQPAIELAIQESITGLLPKILQDKLQSELLPNII
jgi:hypothetical protein